jgi:hypothetical protein
MRDMQTPEHLDAARSSLLAEIALFITDRRITESTFGRLAVNDGKFVERLRSGGNMTTALLNRAHDFIQGERAKAAAD